MLAATETYREFQTNTPWILVVEDDDDTGETLIDLLEDNGYDVQRCADALEAFDVLERRSAPELILLDLFLPEIDGWEFRARQLGHPRFSRIPVIAVSA